MALHASGGQLGAGRGLTPSGDAGPPVEWQSLRHVNTQARTCGYVGVDAQSDGATQGLPAVALGTQSEGMVAGVLDDQYASVSVGVHCPSPGWFHCATRANAVAAETRGRTAAGGMLRWTWIVG